jgi:N-sulfoglucosamine sulfohydrolase
MNRRYSAALFAVILIAAVVVSSSAAAEGKRPNILFAIADDASFPHMGAYGTEWVKTPAFDRVAKEGILFTRAYTPNAKCAPSRSCIITGRNSWQLEEAVNHVAPFPQKFASYGEALDAKGYFVGSTGKGWGPGDAGMRAGKRRQLVGTPFNKKKLDPPTSAISRIDYAGNFEEFLNTNAEGEPWCFWYGGFEPHRRYEYGSGVEKGGKSVSDIKTVPAFWPDDDITRIDMLDYAYEIEYFDQHLQRMLDALEARGELDNTLVVVTADNGMPFPRIKGQEYELSNHLPLAIMWVDGIEKPGRVIDDFVNFIDFAPTFLDVADVEWATSGMASATGKSLVSLFQSGASGITDSGRDHVLIGKERHDVGRPHDGGYPIRGIVKGDLLYLHNFETERWPAGNPETGYLNCDGGATKTNILNLRRTGENRALWQLAFGKRPGEELYNIKTDPGCMENLAGEAAFDSAKAALRKQLFDELKAQGDPRMTGAAAFFDTIPYVDKRTSGFYERFMVGEKMKAGWVNDTDFEVGPVE